MSEVETLAQLRGLSNVVHMDDHAVFEIRENGRLVGYDLLIRMELLENVGEACGIMAAHCPRYRKYTSWDAILAAD